MATGPNGLDEWVGSAYLFVESSLDKVVLSDAYAHAQQKVPVYRALRTALTGVWVGGYLERNWEGLGLLWVGPGAEAPPPQFFGSVLNYRGTEKILRGVGRRGEGCLALSSLFTQVCPWV